MFDPRTFEGVKIFRNVLSLPLIIRRFLKSLLLKLLFLCLDIELKEFIYLLMTPQAAKLESVVKRKSCILKSSYFDSLLVIC